MTTYDPDLHRDIVGANGESNRKFWPVNKFVILAAEAGLISLVKQDTEPGDTTKVWLDVDEPESSNGTVKVYSSGSWVAMTPALFAEHIGAGGGGGGTWGSITGTLSNQTDLQTALDAKQAADADLTSWAAVTRASGFDTFAATPNSANLRALLTDETGSGGAAVFATGPTISDPDFTGLTDIQQGFAFTGDISPSQITADQNDYAPTGFSTASVLRLSSDASRNITGLAGGSDGLVKLIWNVGSNSIVLKDESASSTAANRFALSADVTISGDSGVLLQYDSTSSRWRVLGGSGGSVGTGDVLITSTDAGAGAGPTFTLYRDSASPAASDVIGQVIFSGEDSAGNTQTYATIQSVIDDPTSTSEYGKLIFSVVTAGTLADELQLTGSALEPVTTGGLSLGSLTNRYTNVHLGAGNGVIMGPSSGYVAFAGDASNNRFELYNNAGTCVTFRLTPGTATIPPFQFQSGTNLTTPVAGTVEYDGDLHFTDSSANRARVLLTPLKAGTTAIAPLKFTSGTNLTTAEAGAVEYDGDVFYGTPKGSSSGRGVITTQFVTIVDTDEGLNNDANLQSPFPTSGDTFNVESSTVYLYEMQLFLTTGTTTHTTAVDFDGGTASFTWFEGFALVNMSALNTTGTAQTSIELNDAAEQILNATSTAASTVINIKGSMKINAGGTFIPQIKFSAAPGGTNTCRVGSYFRMWPVVSVGAS